jgi:hypothetical protein
VGLILQGDGSSAVLEVDGNAAQSFRVGETVSQNWRLGDIGLQHVLLVNENEHVRIEAERETANTLPASPASAVESVPPKLELVQGGPLVMPPDDVARARNQEFLELMRRRGSGN